MKLVTRLALALGALLVLLVLLVLLRTLRPVGEVAPRPAGTIEGKSADLVPPSAGDDLDESVAAPGGLASREVVPGSETAPQGLDGERWGTARGRVVDHQGAPVAEADIWVSAFMNPFEGAVVARSGPDGRFEVPIGEANHLGARKDGYVPSYVVRPHPPKGSAAVVVLALRGIAGRVRGTVADQSGDPIPGALVLVTRMRPDGGPGEGPVGRREDGALAAAPEPAAADDDGFFELRSVEPGARVVFARAPGFVLGSAPVRVEAGRTATVDLTLIRGLVVQGVVRDVAGDAVEGASVGYGRRRRFDAGSVGTAADGSFEISGGSPEGWDLRASKENIGRDGATFAGAPGQVFEWNPVLDPGRILHGRVVDGNGDPIEGVRVSAEGGRITLSDGTRRRSSLRGITDTEGAFRLINAEDDAYGVRVYSGFTLLIERKGVRPSPEPLILRVEREPAVVPSAYVVGRIAFPEGVRAQPAIFPADSRIGGVVFDADSEGGFRDGPWAPGRYRLELHGPGYPEITLATFELADDEELDLGVLRVDPTGTLDAVVRDTRGELVRRGALVVCDRTGGRVFRRTLRDGRTGEIELPPGTYVVRASSREGGAVHLRIDVASGADHPLELTLAPAITLDVAFAFPRGHGDRTVDLDVLDAGEWLVDRQHRAGLRRGETIALQLPPGAYRLVARCGGLEAEAFVDASDGETLPSPVLALR